MSLHPWNLHEVVRRPAPLVPRHAADVVGTYELDERGHVGVELYYTGRQARDDNPYRAWGRPISSSDCWSSGATVALGSS